MRILQLALIGLIFIAKPAFADAQMAAQWCEPAGGTGATVDIGVACANSWPGSGQVLYNTIKFGSAGDTEAQSSVDFVLGGSDAAASNDPTFVGRAGHKGAYFSFDGGDFLKYTGQTGGDQTVVDGFADDWHKNTTDFTVGIAFCFESNGSTQTLFTTKATGASGYGISLAIDTNNEVYLVQRTTAGATTQLTDTNFVDGSCYATGVSHDAGTSNTRIWTTSTTSELITTVWKTWTTGGATAPLTVGAIFDPTITTPSLYFENGTKVYDIMIDNTYYSDADFAAWVADVEARDGIDFTS